MKKIEWYKETLEKISENVEDVYERLYSRADGLKVQRIGKDYRINPCPTCGHDDCCTVSTSVNTVHCFSGSCGWAGNHISAYLKYAEQKGISYDLAISNICKATGIKFYANKESKEYADHKANARLQSIKSIAMNFYHNRLMNLTDKFEYDSKMYTPLEYIKKERKRKSNTLVEFRIGFTGNFQELKYELISQGFTSDEIYNSGVWAPDNLFIFWYKNIITKDIKRLNCKNPFKIKTINKDTGEEGKPLAGFSNGLKLLSGPDTLKFDKDVILVEGEHDMYSVYENGSQNVLCLGGNPKEDIFNVLYKFKEGVKFYMFFDNDEAGDRYRVMLNDYLADRPVYDIKYSHEYNDPDEYFKTKDDAEPTLDELISSAEAQVTDKYKITRIGAAWTISTRDRKLVFHMKSRTEKGAKGSINYYINGKINDREDDIFLNKCKAKIKPLNFNLHDHIDSYLNDDLDSRNMFELIDIYNMSSKKDYIVRLIAKMLVDSNQKDELVNKIKVAFKANIGRETDNVVDSILKELNDIENKSRDDLEVYQKMKLGQFFNVSASDAYMYFTYVRLDGDVKRKLPYLLRNDGAMIRLDLLKRKDSQCLLLVDNKYELPTEINNAVLELNECSLVQKWAEKYSAGLVSEDESIPGLLIRDIEKYLKMFYYTPDNDTYKILALYIYSTYYYEVFGQIPYLFLNGAKGSGKSILDEAIRLLAFNAKMAVDISEAALYRILNIEGGTLILDEQENLTTKSARTTNTTMAACLKAGYSRSGEVVRCNVDDKAVVEKHTVFGPKVISNIMGMDDVIVDRCIVVNTYSMKPSANSSLQDPKVYALEKLNEIRDVTSRCSISALKYFKDAYNIYKNNIFETDNARLSQILTPLLAVAKLVDRHELSQSFNEKGTGEYESALVRYWESKLRGIKSSIEDATNEGIIKYSVRRVAEELYGRVPSNEIEKINYTCHKFNQPIKYNLDEGWFELTTLHFKDYIEQEKPGEDIFAKYISNTVKQVFNMDDSNTRRIYVNITDDDLLREFKGNKKPRVKAYRFRFAEFIDDIEDEFLDLKVEKENIRRQASKKIEEDGLF